MSIPLDVPAATFYSPFQFFDSGHAFTRMALNPQESAPDHQPGRIGKQV
jgi:hypothetical protein